MAALVPRNSSPWDLFRRFYETVGAERIIFGSDSSWFPAASPAVTWTNSCGPAGA